MLSGALLILKSFIYQLVVQCHQANLRLAQNNQDALRSEFSKRTIIEVVSSQRDAIMASVKS